MSKYGERNDWTGLEVAVIGMACRLPGARDIEGFWENLKNGVESVSFFSEEELKAVEIGDDSLNNPDYVKSRGIIEDAEFFDPAFFGYKPLEAEVMDPQIRVFYESCWEVLEFAGYHPETYDGLIGLYAGANNNRRWEMLALLGEKANLLGGFAIDHLTDRDFLSTRIAFKLNLRGPAITLKTACSTGLVAVDLACRGLLTGQCDIALAGAVTVMSNSVPGYTYRDGMILSPDGHCRAFAANAQGVHFSEGSGAVVLKRLRDAIEDRDTIHAVIKGSAVNNDGNRKGAYEAPCIEGQEEVVRAAIHMAEVDPETITYVETHGTGTTIGDPIEIEGLKRGFNTDKKGFCPIGSAKSNFGHLDTAAGIAGFIKVVLALKHRLIPPSLHFEKPNPTIDFADSPFYVNTKLMEWKNNGHPLRAGVSSFGIGGTNAHIVLEEAPGPAETSAGRARQVVTISARTESALNKAAENLVDYFKENKDVNMADAAYTLQVGRKAFKHRKMWLVDANPSSRDFRKSRTALARDKNRLVFMFPGQGAQYVNMGKDLYRTERIFREEMDKCFDLLEPLMGRNIKNVLYPGNGKGKEPATDNPHPSLEINQTAVTQPVIFAFEYALAKFLMHLGIKPYAMIGHSIGEYTAACLSGVFSLKDALKAVALRGKSMQQMPTGAMLSITLPEDELVTMLQRHKELALAAVNAPSLCVVSGPHEAIDAFENQLKEKGHECRRLHTSHAYHSGMMDPVLKTFKDELSRGEIILNRPRFPYVSNVTGEWITVEEAMSPGYWAGHLRNTVRFFDGLTPLVKDPGSIFIELGPGRSLSTFVQKHSAKQTGHVILNLVKHPKEENPDDYYLLSKIGQLWLYGEKIDWTAFYGDEKRRRIPLPTYPFQRQRYRIDGGLKGFEPKMPLKEPPPGKKSDIAEWFYVPSWKRSTVPLYKPVETPGPLHWLVFTDEKGIGPQLVKQLKQEDSGDNETITVVRMGSEFTLPGSGGDTYTLDPRWDDYRPLIAQLKNRGRIPNRIVHLWNVTAETNGGEEINRDEAGRYEDRGFYSLIFLAQAIAGESIDEDIQVTVVTDNMQEVTGEEDLCPWKATVLGPAMVIPMEYSNIRCRSIDIVVPPAGSKKEQGLIRQLAAEVRAGTAAHENENVIAYRNNYRLVQTHEPLPLEAPAKEVPHLKKGGVYLITGGTGGIGLEMARYLSTTVGAKLILTGRSPLPGREEWQQWLDTHSRQDKTGVKIRKIRELEETGAQVTVFSADVSDYDRMKEVIAAAEKRLGTIDGVIHAAGVPGGGMIQLKTRQKANEVLAPKVKGTMVLHWVLKDRPLDFFILCSSVNSVIPLLGQVDYYAANAFLDAFAYYKTSGDGIFTVSINWDTWQQVGMAVEAAKQFRVGGGRERPVDHPLFDRCIHEDPDREIYVTHFAMDKHWVLSEHKVSESGQGLVPGVTYLEMAREAFEKHTAAGNGGSGVHIEISDVYFFNPLMVGEGEERETRFILKKQKETGTEFPGYDFQVRSRAGSEDDWQMHASGKICTVEITGNKDHRQIQHNIGEIAAACNKKDILVSEEKGRSEEGFLVFGPRWRNIKRIQLGENRGLGTFKLSEAFAADLDFYKLHPALLDSAAGFLFSFVGKSAYIPFSYKRLTIKAPLPEKIFSYSRVLLDSDGDGASREKSKSLKFDITVMDEHGVELADIKEFTMLNVSEQVKGKIDIKEEEKDESKNKGGRQKEFFKNAILPPEGIDVFSRIMTGTLPQVVVSTTDLAARIANNKISPSLSLADGEEIETIKPADPAQLHARPEISAVYVAPKTETQRKIVEVWQALLGVDRVGIHDDFFELGGDSLNIVQLNNELKRTFKKDIPVAVMFRYQTVHTFTQYLKGDETAAAAEEADRSDEIEKSKNRLKARMKRR